MICEIKQAIADKIKELYPNSKVYDEEVPQGFKDGSFFITVIDGSYTKSIANKYRGSVPFDLAYFPTDTGNRNNECYLVAQNIFRSFDILDNGHRLKGKTFNITDDVLHIQFTVKYQEIKSETGEKMNNMAFMYELK